MEKNVAITLSLCILTLFILTSCSKDKGLFKKAEKAYNTGQINTAKRAYEELISKYPTSMWRSTAEKQLEKCKAILELHDQAKEYEANGYYEKAIDSYKRISEINSAYIDTAAVMDSLRTLLKEELAKFTIPHPKTLMEEIDEFFDVFKQLAPLLIEEGSESAQSYQRLKASIDSTQKVIRGNEYEARLDSLSRNALISLEFRKYRGLYSSLASDWRVGRITSKEVRNADRAIRRAILREQDVSLDLVNKIVDKFAQRYFFDSEIEQIWGDKLQ